MPRLNYIDQPCKSVLNRVEGMPFKWSINPYTGCSHACRYCYARAFYTRADRGQPGDFDTRVYVKTNAPEVLRAELALSLCRTEVISTVQRRRRGSWARCSISSTERKC